MDSQAFMFSSHRLTANYNMIFLINLILVICFLVAYNYDQWFVIVNGQISYKFGFYKSCITFFSIEKCLPAYSFLNAGIYPFDTTYLDFYTSSYILKTLSFLIPGFILYS